jgi:hypothetical protein
MSQEQPKERTALKLFQEAAVCFRLLSVKSTNVLSYLSREIILPNRVQVRAPTWAQALVLNFMDTPNHGIIVSSLS